jgi:hypothetical protein
MQEENYFAVPVMQEVQLFNMRQTRVLKRKQQPDMQAEASRLIVHLVEQLAQHFQLWTL